MFLLMKQSFNVYLKIIKKTGMWIQITPGKKKAKKSSQNFKTNHLFERAVHSHGKNSNSLRD